MESAQDREVLQVSPLVMSVVDRAPACLVGLILKVRNCMIVRVCHAGSKNVFDDACIVDVRKRPRYCVSRRT